MKKSFLIIIITLILPYCLYAQTYTLKGKIVYKDTPVSDALIVVEIPHKTFNTISDEKGLFKLNHEFAINDSIYISAHKEGYTSIARVKIDPNQSSTDLQFTELIYSLPEVVVATNKNVIKKANKTIYKNNSNLFLKKAKADVALRELPNISFANGDFRINNRKSVMLFIDGVEASVEEIKRLDVKDIDRFEVISNPSASYGSELHGGVINIIKKEKMEHYIKSEIEAGKGVRLDAFNVSPSVSYKNKSLIVNTFYSYTTNNQDNHSELERINDGLKTEQSIDKNVKGWQDYFSGRMNLILSKKSNISLTGNLFRYKFNSDSRGSLTENNTLQDIQYNTIEKLKNLNINGIYRYQINNKSQLLMKGRFFDYKTKEGFKSTDSTSIVISTIREYSSEMVYEKKQITLLEASTNYSIGSKYIHRKYAFGLDNFYFSQNVYSFYLNLDTEINSKLSLFASFYYDYTHNRNYDINKNYGNVLPSLSLLYKLNNSSNLTFDYSRKITRPSAEYLNPNPVIIGSLQILKGNPDLLPQITDNMEVTFSKSFNNDNSMTINIYNNIYQRLIDQIYTTSNGDVVNSYANIGNAHVSGVSTGLTTKIFHLISLNFNAGVDYNSFSSSSNLAIVHKNSGYSFNGNANAYVLLKNDLSINLNCNYRSRNYSLVQTRRTMPLLILDVEKNLFKERMTVKLDYFDMFGFFSKSKGYINSKLFSQSITNNDRMTNLTLSVVFRLGKNFSDHFKNPVINNDDIHTK